MKRKITKVTLQANHIDESYTVFTEYEMESGGKYDGFNAYKNYEEAVKAAEDMVNTDNEDFISVVSGYHTIKFFKALGRIEDWVGVNKESKPTKVYVIQCGYGEPRLTTTLVRAKEIQNEIQHELDIMGSRSMATITEAELEY